MKKINSTADLQAQITQLNKRNVELENTVAELNALLQHFKELFKLSKDKQFGISSEKSEQISFLDDCQYDEIDTVAPPETQEISYTRRKQKGKRQEDLSKLPLEIVEHEFSEDERLCSDCGNVMSDIGVDTRDEIKIIPAQVIHVEHRRHVYKCVECAKTSEKTPIVKANMPQSVIKGSVASASAVAYIITQKHLMHLPFYRLEQDFLRQGVFINRQNMANWSMQVCEDWLAPIYSKLQEQLLSYNCLHGDETTLQVLKEPGKKAEQKSYMWLYRTGQESKKPVVLYEYQPNRRDENPKNFLKGWCGYLHTDGYSAYHNINNVTVIGCWAHVRRKFNDAFKITKAPDSLAKIGLDFCTRLFALEREFARISPDERLVARLKHAKPIADAFFEWAQSVNVPSGLAISRALNYALNQREFLENVFLDGRLDFSNNRAERSIKPFVIGRKNWLFCNSVSGAKASAIAFSIIETAKENGLKPFEYLRFLLETLPNIKTQSIDDLMPWSNTIPPECRFITT